MPIVRLQISPRPSHVRTARLVSAAVARQVGLSDSTLDEIRLAVGEACSLAVSLHETYVPGELITVVLEAVVLEAEGTFVVTVCDSAPTGSQTGQPDPLKFVADPGSLQEPDTNALPSVFGMAILSGLVDDLEISPATDGPGTVVRMRWPLPDQSESALPQH